MRHTTPLALLTVALSLGLQTAAAFQDSDYSGQNCTFQAAPDAFLQKVARSRQEVAAHADKLNRALAASSGKTVDAGSIPHVNFIDDEIFGKLIAAGVPSARLTTDEEFVRRLTLDLTGRIPASSDVRDFVADTDPDKRNKLIQKLLYSDEFTDKWTMWLGDVVQNNANSITQPRNINGRNALYKYLWGSVVSWKSLKDMSYELASQSGNNYDESTGAAGFIVNARTPGGPAQDTYDTSLVKTATAFLGMSNYDCLLCHSGRGHLDQINLWGARTTRLQAEQMAAFFARVNMTPYSFPANTPLAVQQADFYYQSFTVADFGTNTYKLNTNYGNRPNRVTTGGLTQLTPIYHFTGATPKDDNWRSAFADNMIADPMFAINWANRLWKAMFNLALAEPVDQLDPLRLDPNNPPPDPWALQATHPVLLQKLANEFVNRNWDLRETLRLIVQSSAYQLSSRYDGDWNVQYVPLFARHLPRRLAAEEIHDAISKASGNFNTYTIQGWGAPVKWAMQFPDTSEPRSNGGVVNFLNYFLRGDRDNVQRSQASSIQQQLALMNDNFVVTRIKAPASPTLQAVAKLGDDTSIMNEMFLTFVGRMPDDYEKKQTLAFLGKATTAAAKTAAIEDLSWALINKLDFLFSY